MVKCCVFLELNTAGAGRLAPAVVRLSLLQLPAVSVQVAVEFTELEQPFSRREQRHLVFDVLLNGGLGGFVPNNPSPDSRGQPLGDCCVGHLLRVAGDAFYDSPVELARFSALEVLVEDLFRLGESGLGLTEIDIAVVIYRTVNLLPCSSECLAGFRVRDWSCLPVLDEFIEDGKRDAQSEYLLSLVVLGVLEDCLLDLPLVNEI